MNTIEKQRIDIVKSYIDSYNNFDVEGMIKDMSHDVVFKNITNEKVDLITNGNDEFKAQAEKALSFFSQRKQQIIDVKQEGDVFTVGIYYEGTLAIDLPNGMKKGDVLTMQGKSIFTFQELKIIEINDIS